LQTIKKFGFIFIGLTALIGLVMFFDMVFSGRIILSQTFQLGPLSTHYYGITMALAVGSGFYLAIKRAAKYGVSIERAENLLFYLIIFGFIGARLYHVASSFQYYVQHPLDIIKVWQGGLSIYGALFGGFLCFLILQKIFNLQSSIFNLLDWLAPSVILGQIIGRFGNFFNYEAFGYPTNLPWKMFVPAAFRPEQYLNFQYFHPAFLYEAIGNTIILFFLLKYGEKGKAGSLFFSYLLLYNILRFFIELIRTDSVFIGIYRQNAAVSLALVIVSVFALYSLRSSKNAKIS